jgi:hypothetical protein
VRPTMVAPETMLTVFLSDSSYSAIWKRTHSRRIRDVRRIAGAGRRAARSSRSRVNGTHLRALDRETESSNQHQWWSYRMEILMISNLLLSICVIEIRIKMIWSNFEVGISFPCGN